MRHEIRKISKITDEITTFLLEHHAKQINIQVQNLKGTAIIIAKAYGLEDMEETIEQLREHLSYPREVEMEEYYWELNGECTNCEALELVAAMIDEVRIDYNDERIYIELIRKK